MAQEGDRTPPLAPTHAPPPHVEEALRDADANKDGFISKEELQAFQDRVVKEADANKDGKISAEEWRNHHRAKMQQRDCVKP
jgi:Ca2+-binding EF-hand superfamily protein